MYSAVDIGVLEDGRLDAFIIGDSGILGFFALESIVTRTNVRFLDGARAVDGRVPSEPHQRAVAPRQLGAVSSTDQKIRQGRVLLDPGLLMADPVLAARDCRLRRRLDDDSRRRSGFLLGVRRLLPASGIVLHLEAGDGVVQTILPAAGVLPAGEPALESLDRLERPRSLDLLPLFCLTARRRGRTLALGRLEDPGQRLHLPSHLGQRLVRVPPRREAVVVAQSTRERPGRRRLRRAADGEGVAGEFLAIAVRRVTFRQLGDRLSRRLLAAVQRHVERGPPFRRLFRILGGQHVFAFPKSLSSKRRGIHDV